MNKLLIYIVSYQRKEYTQGNIINISKVLPKCSQIVVCDNGSTDGTREWLLQNKSKYNFTLLFPEKNLRVGGAWTLLTNRIEPNAFDYILLLDNDHWMIPNNKNWFNECLDIFHKEGNVGSLGLMGEMMPGYFSMGTKFDPNYKNKKKFNSQEIYDTVFYAGCRLDKFNLWHQTMNAWRHQFIGDTIGRSYNSKGYRTIKLTPGYCKDISEYDFRNENFQEYNTWFFNREKPKGALEMKLKLTPSIKEAQQFVLESFGKESYNILYANKSQT